MALWPDYFGEEGHTRAVSFGAQTKMNGINMLTACVLGVTPDVPRVIGVAQPGRGRASRATQVGDLAFIIGVRGHENPNTKEKVIQETDGAFDAQLANCFDWLQSHMAKSGLELSSLVRIDAALRDVNQAERYRAYARSRLGGKVPFGGFAVGTILGGRCEQELGAIAVAPGVQTDILWLPGETQAESVRAGNLVFLTASSGVTSGIMGKARQELYNDLGAQVGQSLNNIKAALARRNLGLDSLLRLDVFLRDIYAEPALIGHLKAVLGKDMPVLNIIGTEPEFGADVELVAVAGL
jgi:enamine deaminase RidA (YjgF/YER057c/UK114 family)